MVEFTGILGREYAQSTADKNPEASELTGLERWGRRYVLLRFKEWGSSLLQRLL